MANTPSMRGHPRPDHSSKSDTRRDKHRSMNTWKVDMLGKCKSGRNCTDLVPEPGRLHPGLCRRFLRGKCAAGQKCKFAHADPYEAGLSKAEIESEGQAKPSPKNDALHEYLSSAVQTVQLRLQQISAAHEQMDSMRIVQQQAHEQLLLQQQQYHADSLQAMQEQCHQLKLYLSVLVRQERIDLLRSHLTASGMPADGNVGDPSLQQYVATYGMSASSFSTCTTGPMSSGSAQLSWQQPFDGVCSADSAWWRPSTPKSAFGEPGVWASGVSAPMRSTPPVGLHPSSPKPAVDTPRHSVGNAKGQSSAQGAPSNCSGGKMKSAAAKTSDVPNIPSASTLDELNSVCSYSGRSSHLSSPTCSRQTSACSTDVDENPEPSAIDSAIDSADECRTRRDQRLQPQKVQPAVDADARKVPTVHD